jgi:hypothetical protein
MRFGVLLKSVNGLIGVCPLSLGSDHIKWDWRAAFGFTASLVESIPIAGLFFSIPNRIGAAMMYVPFLLSFYEWWGPGWLINRAFDMEKRQHLFSAGVIQPLQPAQVGFYGMGAVTDLGVDIQAAEKEIERKFGTTTNTSDGQSFEVKGAGLGAESAAREKVF